MTELHFLVIDPETGARLDRIPVEGDGDWKEAIDFGYLAQARFNQWKESNTLFRELKGLSKAQIVDIRSARLASDIGEQSEAYWAARAAISEMKLGGWSDLVQAHRSAVVRACINAGLTDNRSIMALTTAVEELVVGLLAMGKISGDDLYRLANPVVLNVEGLGWLLDDPTFEAVKAAIEECYEGGPAAPSALRVVASAKPEKNGHKATKGAKAGKKRTLAGVDVDALRAALEETEEKDRAVLVDLDLPDFAPEPGERPLTQTEVEELPEPDPRTEVLQNDLQGQQSLAEAAAGWSYSPGGPDHDKGWKNPRIEAGEVVPTGKRVAPAADEFELEL